MEISQDESRQHAPRQVSRRAFVFGAAGAIGSISAALPLYATTAGRHHLETVERTFPIANLPDPFEGFRIVQISDIHLEELTEPWFLQKVVDRANALRPDLVLLTGDFVSHGPQPYPFAWKAAGVCAEILSGLNAPQRYAILGNHDSSVGRAQVMSPLEAHGTPFLVDSYVAIERGDSRIWLSGLSDASSGGSEPKTGVPSTPNAPVVLMVHEPDYIDVLVKCPQFLSVDLVLSGHTHGGQVRLPFIKPLSLPPLGQKYVEGLFRFDHLQLYVNRGVGTVDQPFRFNCRPEITHITLKRKLTGHEGV
jgi:predicted MPP superfamily phosphohydrolase